MTRNFLPCKRSVKYQRRSLTEVCSIVYCQVVYHRFRCYEFSIFLEFFKTLQQTCQFHQVVIWITSFDNQVAACLLTTCNRLVANKLSQAMQKRILMSVCC